MTSARALTILLVAVLAGACGKSGPPLPPLVRLPAPPAELTATRRGDSVDVGFNVPAANTDGSRPANLQRVEVYAYTGPATLTDDQIARLGTRVGSVDVKAPRDPNATADPDEPVSDVPSPEGPGLDQGAAASVQDALTPSAAIPVELPRAGRRPTREAAPPAPLAGPPPTPPTRFYAGVGITTTGRRGPFSRQAGVPLVPPPAPVPAPAISYDETTITVTWRPAAGTGGPTGNDEAEAGVLPARVTGLGQPSTAYHVYEVKAARTGSSGAASERAETRLTTSPIDDTRFEDTRIEWGADRCYLVRVARTLGGLTIESEASPATCRTLADTFAPKAPTGLQYIASEGAVNLTWDNNGEKDLAGYLVLRGTSVSGALAAVTSQPIPAANFSDRVPSGARFVYAVQAVDRAGNVSGESARIEETAR